MKKCIKNSFPLSVLIVALASMLAGRLTAQTFKTLADGGSGFDDFGNLILSNNTLYFTAKLHSGDPVGATTFAGLFVMNTDGTGRTGLYNFGSSLGPIGTINEGLVLSGNTLYGTAGTVFKLNTDGTGFTTLHSFTLAGIRLGSPYYTNSDGANPQGGPILSGNTLMGPHLRVAVRDTAARPPIGTVSCSLPRQAISASELSNRPTTRPHIARGDGMRSQ